MYTIFVDVFLPVFGLAALGSIAGLLGGLILLYNKNWGKFLGVHAVAFAAGVLLTISLIDLLPHSLEALSPNIVLPIILAVMVAASLLEQFLVHFHHHEEHQHSNLETAIPLVLFGDVAHNFLDGVAIAASFLVEPRLGLFVAIATFLHELPQEIGDFGILLSVGWAKIKIITFNLLTALSTFLGAGATLLFVTRVSGLTNVLLAVAAGLFLYISATDLLPKLGARSRDIGWHQSLLFLAGVVIMLLVTNLFPG